ncbi:MAG: hemerythrin domain-containing protein [Betaproteobacteria bacterium]|nr:hemerythrin domain-containing protein [Betaproteobacteria bacterium]MDH3435525.1 hemerythrin domain-containing protein [Betaproteobacteria bacterium]
MTSADARPPKASRDRAVAVIQAEHRALEMVTAVLQRVLSDVQQGLVEPDCRLLAAMLYYIESFPEREHHPKEDDYLFKALRARTREGSALLDELQGEHVRGGQMMAYLAQTLVRYQGGAPDGLAAFAAAVDAYAALLGDHMRREEDVILPLADAHLTESDWAAMAAAFTENRDPLFGEEASEEMRRLRRRITSLVPRKLQSLLRPEGE